MLPDKLYCHTQAWVKNTKFVVKDQKGTIKALKEGIKSLKKDGGIIGFIFFINLFSTFEIFKKESTDTS